MQTKLRNSEQDGCLLGERPVSCGNRLNRYRVENRITVNHIETGLCQNGGKESSNSWRDLLMSINRDTCLQSWKRFDRTIPAKKMHPY